MSSPWGVLMPPLVDSLMFVIVTSGRCLVRLDDQSTVLEKGSMVLLPQGSTYSLLSDPHAEAVPLFDIPVQRVNERYEIMQHGGGGEVTRVMAGVVQFDHFAGKRLVALLPRMLRVDAWDDVLGPWIESTIGLIAREATSLRPGGETVMTRLADILVVQAIRAWLDTAPEANIGWLAALRDPNLGRALAGMHRQPAKRWTVATLAGEAGMSRSAFAARFTETVGQPALQYLTQWRLTAARARLIETGESIFSIALQAGYQSETAFSRAFKQLFGYPPGALRRAR